MYDEISKFLNGFNSLMNNRALEFKREVNKGIDQLEQEFDQLQDESTDRERRGLESYPVNLINALKSQIVALELLIKGKDLEIYRLNHEVETYKVILEMNENVQELADKFEKAALEMDNRIYECQAKSIVNQEAIIDKYQIGPKTKSETSKDKWTRANKFFVEENHKTLKHARKIAAEKAGIFVEERQLIKKMPNPNK